MREPVLQTAMAWQQDELHKGTLVIAHSSNSLAWVSSVIGPDSPFDEVHVASSSAPGTSQSAGGSFMSSQLGLSQVSGSNVKTKFVASDNVAHEAGKYLDFIIQRYDDFPPFATFVHDHVAGWHDPHDKVQTLLSLNTSNITGGIEFLSGYCLESMPNDIVLWAWPQLLGDVYPEPFRYSTPCCAQFTVTRQAVLNRGKAFWQNLQRFAHNYTSIGTFSGRVELDAELDKDGAGYILEWMWKPIFSTVPVRSTEFSHVPDFFKRCKATCSQKGIDKMAMAAHWLPRWMPYHPQRCRARDEEVGLEGACQGYASASKALDPRRYSAHPSQQLLKRWGCDLDLDEVSVSSMIGQLQSWWTE
jgi:hypothetical protein